MNTLLQIFTSHRSRRDFTSQPVAESLLADVFEATRRAPTWNNAQNVSWVTVTEPAAKAELARLSGKQAQIERAPVFAVLCVDFHKTAVACARHGVEQRVQGNVNGLLIGVLDAGIVAGTMMNAARAAGLAVCPVGGVRREPQKVIKLLGLPRLVMPMVGVCLGYAPELAQPDKPRLPLSSLWHRERYDGSTLEADIDWLDAQTLAYSAELSRAGALSWSATMATKYAGTGYHEVAETLRQQGFVF
ncbi:MAG: nitroreductase family protein [Pigmentiphaga sp.]|uniref:nitroreductase family protein n=1 Tax=Pigmentiphaga sp. TaxID=1977564 RepID=UPI0029B5A876|nr:nitroreductase family protein [Pigmentiphaga sp.]MDX3904370.1 nitroreductase family protein [Pigmentiphaga sp.]